MSKFDQVLASLKSERETVQRELKEINVRRTELLEDSKRIEKAITALANSPRKQIALKTPSFETFRQIALDLFSRNDSLLDVDLKKMIRAQLKHSGCSSAGLTGFYAKLVEDRRIQVEQNRISMQKEKLRVSDEDS